MLDAISFEAFCADIHARVVRDVPLVVRVTGAEAAAGFGGLVEPRHDLASWCSNGFTAIVLPVSATRVAVLLTTTGGSLVMPPLHDDLSRDGARRVAEAVAALLAGPGPHDLS